MAILQKILGGGDNTMLSRLYAFSLYNKRKKFDLTPWLILAFSVITTIIVYHVYSNYLIKQENDEFEKESYRIVDKIMKRMDHYGEVLQAGRGLFAASKTVERDEWKAFIDTQKIQERFPGIQGVGYQKRTADAETFLKDMQELQTLGLLNRDQPIIDQDGYYRYIFYLEPVNERNKKAYGYNMLSEPVRREAIERSRDNDAPALSGKVTLVQEITEKKQAGFLLYLPVYENGKQHQTVEERNRYLIGNVYAPFRAGDFINGIITERVSNLDLHIYDNTVSDETLMYDYSELYNTNITQNAAVFTKEIPINNFGRTWIIVFHWYEESDSRSNNIMANIVLIAGLTLSVFLFFISKKIREINRRNNEQELDSKIVEVRHKTEVEHLEKINKLKTEFVSVISHELKTPLVSIQGYAEMLNMKTKNLTEDQKVEINEIHKNAVVLDSIINDLLDTQKLELEKISLSKSYVDINKLVDNVVYNFKPLSGKKSIRIESQISEKIDLVCDEYRLVQILNNLIKNAIESINHKTGLIILSVKKGPGEVVFSVNDNGSGMNKQQLDRLFKKFYQTDTSLARKKGGSGLGLYIINELIKLHGGKIWVESELGKGTTFYFSIPT